MHVCMYVCMYVCICLPMPDCHTCVSSFRVFQVSTISGVWPTPLKLGCVTNFDTLFLVMGLFLWVMKFNLC